MHWTGYFVFVCVFLAPAYLVWRVTWKPERSSKSGWQLIVAMGVLYTVMCSPGLLFGSLRAWAFLAGGLIYVAVLALELWSRDQLHQRLEGGPAVQAQTLWRFVLILSLVAVWIWIGDHIGELRKRYASGPYPPSATFIADYPFKVAYTLVVGVITSVLVYSVVGLLRNLVGLVRGPRSLSL